MRIHHQTLEHETPKATHRGDLTAWAHATSRPVRPAGLIPEPRRSPKLRNLPRPMPQRPATVHVPSEVVLPIDTPSRSHDLSEQIDYTHSICDRINRAIGLPV